MFFELYSHGVVYANAALDFRYPPNCLFHLEVHRWGHNILKELYNDWQVALKIMRTQGVERIVATKSGTIAEQKSYSKMLRLFGFGKPINFTVSEQYIK